MKVKYLENGHYVESRILEKSFNPSNAYCSSVHQTLEFCAMLISGIIEDDSGKSINPENYNRFLFTVRSYDSVAQRTRASSVIKAAYTVLWASKTSVTGTLNVTTRYKPASSQALSRPIVSAGLTNYSLIFEEATRYEALKWAIRDMPAWDQRTDKHLRKLAGQCLITLEVLNYGTVL